MLEQNILNIDYLPLRLIFSPVNGVTIHRGG